MGQINLIHVITDNLSKLFRYLHRDEMALLRKVDIFTILKKVYTAGLGGGQGEIHAEII